MKKVLILLLSGFFLYGCGTGASTTASSNGTTPGGVSQASTAKVFTLNLVDSGKVTAKTIPGTALPVATDVRVVIRQYGLALIPDYDGNGDPIPGTYQLRPSGIPLYQDIQDFQYSATGSVNIGIPAGDGYTIDVITSKNESGNHIILKYGQGTSIIVGPNNTNATITINDMNAIIKMTVADNVSSKGSFIVNLSNVLPLDPSYKMTMSFGTLGSVPTVVSSLAPWCTFTAPTSYTEGTVYLQGQFTLNKSLLNQGETQAKWVRTFPNASYGEEVSSQLSPLYTVAVPF